MLKLLLVMNILLKIVDIGTTAYAIGKAGTIIEVNPILRNAMEMFGVINTLQIIFVLHSLLVYILYLRKSKSILFVVFIALLIVVGNNIFNIGIKYI